MPSRKRPSVVREPLQVYLTPQERKLLDRVARQAGLSRAEVMRRGLRRFGAEALGQAHPGVEFIDVIREGWPKATPADVAVRHDEYLGKAYAGTKKPKR